MANAAPQTSDRTLNGEQRPVARLRRRHERLLFRHIRAQEPVSRSQLADHSGLSAQAVGNIVRSLLDAGLVEETAMQRGQGPGGPPIGLRVRPDGAFALGFGIERNHLTAAVVDLAGNVVWARHAPQKPGQSPQAALAQLTEWAATALKEQWPGRPGALRGVGVGAPGPIDPDTGAIVSPPNFPGWDRVEVVTALAAQSKLPVILGNNTNASAIAYCWKTRRPGASLLYCHWDEGGIGGALVLRGELQHGTKGNAAEVGHFVVNPLGRPCSCGSTGCVEAEASVRAILSDAQALGPFDSLAAVVDAARQSDRPLGLLRRAAEQLGAALVSALNFADVDEIVLGGDSLQLVATIFTPIITRWVKQAVRAPIADTAITVSPLGEESRAIGAGLLALHALVPNPESNV